MYVDLNGALVFMLVMMRMTGMLALNPIFGRNNIPVILRAGLAFIMAIILTSLLPFPAMPEPTLANFAFMTLAELMIGFAAGVLINLFLSIIATAGEVVDMQMGFAMANVFDPNSNMSMALTATVFNAIFLLAFFTTGNYLNFIYLIVQTFGIIPLGTVGFSPEGLLYLPNFFSTILVFSAMLALPMVVVQVIVTLAVGVIMRIVPQINIFVLNIQIKLVIGILVLVFLLQPMMAFFNNLWNISFERLWELLNFMAP